MDAVEWVEIVTLVVLVALVAPIYWYMATYTKILVNQRTVIADQGETISANTERLSVNARELKELRDGIATIATSFQKITALLDTDPPRDLQETMHED